MPKIKTHKVISKRIKVTGNGKLVRKHAGHDHFNARENGDTGIHKRREQNIRASDHKNIAKAMPYN